MLWDPRENLAWDQTLDNKALTCCCLQHPSTVLVTAKLLTAFSLQCILRSSMLSMIPALTRAQNHRPFCSLPGCKHKALRLEHSTQLCLPIFSRPAYLSNVSSFWCHFFEHLPVGWKLMGPRATQHAQYALCVCGIRRCMAQFSQPVAGLHLKTPRRNSCFPARSRAAEGISLRVISSATISRLSHTEALAGGVARVHGPFGPIGKHARFLWYGLGRHPPTTHRREQRATPLRICTRARLQLTPRSPRPHGALAQREVPPPYADR